MSHAHGVNGAARTTFARCLQCGRKGLVQASLKITTVDRCDQCRKLDHVVPATYPDEMPGTPD